jgi:hypothetical protein
MTEPDSLVDAFVRTRELLVAAADAVPPGQRRTPFVGHWDLLALLAHLVGWDYTNLKAVDELKAGRLPDFYRHYDPGWAAYNQQLIDRYGTGDWRTLCESLLRSQEAVVAALRLLTAEEMTRELSEPGRRRPVGIANILRAAIRDEREHLAQIRGFTGTPS